jgi:molybdate transport system regulatory protein
MCYEMSRHAKLKPSCKVWIEFDGKRVLGKGGAAILEQIDKLQSISKTAGKLGMSYRYVWNYLDEVKKTMGEPVVETFKGGKVGGGGARLNELGKYLLSEYIRISSCVERYVSDEKSSEVNVVKISARNHLKGKVSAVKKDGVMALVKVKVTEPAEVTALISSESVEDLKIKVGDQVEAIIKATEVMIAK